MMARHPLVVKLKSGEYDGTDIMEAWLLIESLSTEVSDLRTVYKAAEGVALNKGAARELSINILIDVLAAVSGRQNES